MIESHILGDCLVGVHEIAIFVQSWRGCDEGPGCGYLDLLRLHSVLLGENSHPTELSIRIFKALKHRGFEIYGIVLRKLESLLAYISTNQISLNRDNSTRLSISQEGDAAIISGEFRLCLNIILFCVFVNRRNTDFVKILEESNLHSVLQSALLLHTDTTIPVRKVVFLMFFLLSIHCKDSDIYLPRNTCVAADGPLSTLLHSIPFLRVPSLSSFRSFLAIALHQNSLRHWTSEESVRKLPAALEEGIKICEEAMIDFIKRYKFHEAEIELMRGNPDLSHAFYLYVKHMIPESVRKNLIRVESNNGGRLGRFERFSICELAKHVVSNYQLSLNATASNGETSSLEESESESEPESVKLVHEAFNSCRSWLATQDNQDEVIEAIADAAVSPPLGFVEKPLPPLIKSLKSFVSETVFNLHYSGPALKDLIVVLLKILLSSCRGATDPSLSPTNHASFDLDRDHLVTLLERYEISFSSLSSKRPSRINFETISNAITGILLILLKLHHDQSDLIQNIISASNGCLVLLKIITSFPSDNSIFHDDSNDLALFDFLNESKSWSLAVPPRVPTTVFRALKCLYILCKHSTSRIKKYLVHYKVAVVLKRFFMCPNVGILKVSYKLFKLQMRFLGKKWKLLHIKLLSCCFNATSLDLIDDWIITDPDPDNSSIRSVDTLDESRLMISDHNSFDLDYSSYLEDARNIDFTHPNSLKAFCNKHNEKASDFFGFGIESYSEWLKYGVGF